LAFSRAYPNLTQPRTLTQAERFFEKAGDRPVVE
jgi:hypothetical protein